MLILQTRQVWRQQKFSAISAIFFFVLFKTRKTALGLFLKFPNLFFQIMLVILLNFWGGLNDNELHNHFIRLDKIFDINYNKLLSTPFSLYESLHNWIMIYNQPSITIKIMSYHHYLMLTISLKWHNLPNNNDSYIKKLTTQSRKKHNKILLFYVYVYNRKPQ